MANEPPTPNPYGSLRYVDSVAGNLLFRGPSPVQTREDGSSFFDYDGLKGAIAAAPNRPPLPSSYYLVLINLVHSNEGPHITVEADFFRQSTCKDPNPNQDKGQVQFWDTYGTDRCYFQTEPWLQHELIATLEEWLPDPLIWRVVTLRRWLENPSTLPIQKLPHPNWPNVFYVHCDGGCDRTSEMIGGYRLRYLPSSWTMQNAWSNMCNEHPCSNVMGCGNYKALQWYAFWLNQTQGYSLTGIGLNDGGCNNGEVGPWCSPPA
jgi:hypothetical protein